MTESEKIIKFLKEHPLISIHALEKEIGIYARNLDKAVKGERGIPDQYIEPLHKSLSIYGLKQKEKK
jgi:hypothetical protein